MQRPDLGMIQLACMLANHGDIYYCQNSDQARHVVCNCDVDNCEGGVQNFPRGAMLTKDNGYRLGVHVKI